MPLQATSGAASYDAFGGGVPVAANYIEDVFSTWLYTGNGSTQTITNGIDLAGKGGLVWIKQRNAVIEHFLYDTTRGALNVLESNSTTAAYTASNTLTAFGSTGFTLGSSNFVNGTTSGPRNYASWTFREQPKFFDVVTYTGDGVAGRQISHALGSVPGCIIVKGTDSTYNWPVYHQSLGAGYLTYLNLTNASTTSSNAWANTSPTSTSFYVSTSPINNEAGKTYVAYLFAHNAGGFGLTGTDNVISCGSYTGTGAVGNAINLGYEAQWVMIKRTDADGYDWNMFDVMRGMSLTGSSRVSANTSAAEINSTTPIVSPTATGFSLGATTAAFNGDGGTYIYIAIRRGPMKVPTTGTSVFSPNLQTGGGTVTTNFPVDLIISTTPSQSGSYRTVNDRLRGGSTTRAVDLYTNVTDAETTGTGYGFGFDNNTGYRDAYYSNSFSDIYWNFRRAPGFFDEVCWNGTSSNGGASATFNHNLGVVPEMIIVKLRAVNGASGHTPDWFVYTTALNSQYGYPYNGMYLNSSAAFTGVGMISSAPTATTFALEGQANVSPATYVAYLFASCPGVSKVFNYTGNGSSQTINCGFTGGARFVMIKRTDSTGDWYVWDTARGIVANNDPHLSLNTTAAEVTTNDTIDTDSTGFVVNQVAATNVNVNGASYIGLAIA